MADNNYIIQLKAALDKAKSEKQINQDLKAIEKNIRQLNLVASLYKGDSKKQLDSVIAELESKVQVVKLRTKFDQKQTQKEVGEALNNVSFSDIKLDKQGIELAAQKAYNILDSVISKHTITPAIEWKKGKLQKELQDFLKQNSKIQESAAFKKLAEEVEGLFAAASNADTLDYATEKFKLFKSEAKATGYASTSISSIFTGIFKNAVKLADKLDLVNFGIQKFKESIGTLKDMSPILNDISKASNITQKDLKQLADDSFQIAGKYGKSGTNYLESVRKMARSGYGDNSKEMGELSLLAQSAGEMTADLANRYLLATDSAYKYGGQVEKLTAALDGANNVSDKNNISLTEIAEASRISASDASKAGISIDQLTAAEAAMIAVTKGSGSEIGETFQSVLLHLQKVKGEFNGEIIDDAQIQKLENRCEELGVQLETMGQNGTKLREPMDILKELSEVYRTLPDGSDQKQGLLADLGGKHADSLSALLDNWDLYEKMLSDFSQGGGSALKEAAQEADSWEGRIVSLQNSWDSLVNSLTNQDYVKGGISFLDNAIQGFEKLTDTIGAVPVLLTALNTALLAKKSDYGITQMFNPDSGKIDIQGNLMGIDFTAIKNQKKHFEEAASAIEGWNKKLQLGQTDINEFNESIVKNNAVLKEYLSKCSEDAPASLEGYMAYLKAAGIETDALRLKTTLMTAGMSLLSGIAMQLAIIGVSKLVEAIDDQIHAVEKAKDVLSEAKSNFDSVKSELQGINDELSTNKTRLDELNAFPSLTYVEQGELDKLKEITKELERQKDIKNIELRRSAENLSEANRNAFNKEYNDNNFSLDDVNMLSGTDTPAMTLAQDGLEGLAAAIIKVHEAQKEAQNAGDGEWLNNMEVAENEYKKQLEDNLPKLQEYRNNLTEIMNYRSLTKDEQAFYDNLEQGMRLIYQFTDPSSWNQMEFNQIFNNKSLDVTKEKLIELARDGKLDENTIKQYSKLNEALSQTDLILNDGETTVQSFIGQIESLARQGGTAGETAKHFLSKEDIITNINSLSEGFGFLDKIMDSMSDKDPFNYALLNDKKFTDEFKGMGKSYTDFIETISSSPKDVNAAKSVFDNLVTTWIDSKGVLNGLTEDNAGFAASILKNMGVANAEEIVTSHLTQAYAELAAQKYYNSNVSDLLSNATIDGISAFVNEGVASGVSEQALSELALQKLSVNDIKIDTASDIDQIIGLANAAGASATVMAKLASAKAIIGKAESGTLNGSAADLKQLEYAQQMVSDIENGTFDYEITLDPDKFKTKVHNNVDDNKPSGSGSKSYVEKDTTIDFSDRLLQLLEDKRAELKEKASKTYIDYLGITQNEFNRAQELISSNVSPMSSELDELFNIAQKAGISIGELYSLISKGSPSESRENYLSQVLEVDKTMLEEYKKSVQLYQSEYDQALSKVSPEYKAKIEVGDISIDTLSGGEAANVQDAIAKRNKLIDEIKKQSNMEKQYIEDTIAPYENRSAAIENDNKQLENANSLLEKQIDYYKSAGEIVDSSLYEKLIHNTKDEIINTNNLLSNKKAELQEFLNTPGTSKDSEQYGNLKAEINDAEGKIYALKKAQEEYNKQLLQMPIDNLSTVISMYKDISSSIENWGSEMEASGKKLDSNYYHQLISNGLKVSAQYEKQVSLIEEAMTNYTEGSDTWNELYGQLQDVNSEMSSMVQNLQKWNEELLNMPLERISGYSSDLQKVADGLSNVKSEYDTVISAVTGALNDQIDAINKQKDAVNEEYEASKNALQDKLDLLNKQNNELKLQQKYEQSLYNLQKVNQQATEKVIRDGQIVYEQDSDKLREAQEAFQDAKFDLETSQIQTQIDDLQETLDGLNEKYQDQIDSLQKISDKWSEISDKITQVQNEAKASEVLGNNWKDKVLSGNDADIFNNFSGMYTDISNQLVRYQEQIDTTNNIYSLLEDYIASYKDGSLSYGEALTGINNLLSQMNKKMLAGDNLKNIYDYLGTVNGSGSNANDILAGIQQGLTASASELVKSLELYNKNSGMISEYTSSWQQLTNNVSSMLDVLREVRDNLENASDDEDDDDDGDDNADGEPYMGGPRVESGPGWNYKNGIENGLVGSSSASNREAKMKLLGLKKLDSDELAAILHKKEAVFNPDQQDMLLTNLSKAWNYIPAEAPYYTDAAARAGQPVTKFEFGDINIQKCDNVDALAQGILNGGLRSAMIQQAGIR